MYMSTRQIDNGWIAIFADKSGITEQYFKTRAEAEEWLNTYNPEQRST